MPAIPAFATIEEANSWLQRWLDDRDETCVDNRRFAFKDVPAEMENYETQQDEGCCGFFDKTITVNGRYAMIGCNYGH